MKIEVKELRIGHARFPVCWELDLDSCEVDVVLVGSTLTGGKSETSFKLNLREQILNAKWAHESQGRK